MQLQTVSQILEYVDFSGQQEIAECAQTLRTDGGDGQKLNEIILRLQRVLKEHHSDPYNTKSPYYHFLLACAYSLSAHQNASNSAERAEYQFKNQGLQKNRYLCCWLLGCIFWEHNHLERARDVTEEAIRGFQSLIKNESANGKYEDCECCQAILDNIYDLREKIGNEIENQSDSQEEKVNEQEKNQPDKPSLDGEEGFIYLPQIPVYTHVQAGSDGPIWIRPSQKKSYTVTNQLTINDHRYIIYSVTRGDRRITLDANRKYGWAEVKGNSMNKARPTAIDSGNMVLFYQSSEAKENAFVIVSCPDGSGNGESYMVKRWKKANREFISDSSESGHPPIPYGADFRIIGIVVAVAKPG